MILRKGSWRPTSSYEPIIMLAKSAKYFADGEAVKQPLTAGAVSRNQYTRILDDPEEQFAAKHDHDEWGASGANLRDVWTIASEPLKEKHYAAFPSELVYRCLKAGTSAKGYCPTCGGPWCRMIEETYDPKIKELQARRFSDADPSRNNPEMSKVNGNEYAALHQLRTLGWRPSCSCPEAEPRPGLVLDPFAGSCRTGIQAQRLGLDFVGCELNPEYAAMGRRLLREANPLFA